MGGSALRFGSPARSCLRAASGERVSLGGLGEEKRAEGTRCGICCGLFVHLHLTGTVYEELNVCKRLGLKIDQKR